SGLSGDYEAWAFGGAADELAALVLTGRKTATSSAYPLYAAEGEPLPKAGEYSVILDSRGQAVCVIRTERVCVTPFDEVTARHAAREGEGDLSLEHWRAVHRAFFTREMASVRLAFDEKTDVVCEEFVRVFPK
ncbi:MAG: ASCH domain-containing protein, partial [Clostridia bacterium]|nr:ASCH domain-containing protein [Clostridia bacterium]